MGGTQRPDPTTPVPYAEKSRRPVTRQEPLRSLVKQLEAKHRPLCGWTYFEECCIFIINSLAIIAGDNTIVTKEDPYDALRQRLPAELSITQISEQMQIPYPTVVLRLHQRDITGKRDPQNWRKKLYNREDVIALMRYYRVLG